MSFQAKGFSGDRRAIGLIILLAFAVRAFLSPIIDLWTNIGGGDSGYYLAVADNLLNRGVHSELPSGQPTYYRPPAYAAFIAGILAFGGGPASIFIVQVPLTILAGAVTFLALKHKDRSVALVAGALIAATPFAFFFETRILAEILFVTLLICAWLLLFDTSSLVRSMLAGILMGLAILARDTLVLLPLILLPFALIEPQRWRKLVQYALVATVAYLTVLPWPLRNASLPHGQFVMSDGRVGLNLWAGTWEQNGDWMTATGYKPPDAAFRSAEERRKLTAALAQGDDQVLKKAALERIRSQPFATAMTWIKRYPKLWLGTRSDLSTLTLRPGSAVWTVLKASLYVLNSLVLLTGVAGIVLAIKRRSELLFFLPPILYTAIIYVPFHNTETRYSLAALPFVMIFSSLFLVAAWRWCKSRVKPAT